MRPAFTFREVLFPTDFSDVAREAGKTARDLAHHFGARVHVLHVSPPTTDPLPTAGLAAAVADLGGGLDVVSRSVTGLPARAICDYARRQGIDLIVLGTHGRSGVSRVLLGSVAEAVVRRAPCRVLTVPPTGEVVAATELPVEQESRCVVCAKASADLICASCRALIRGEALERKRGEERPGRAGLPR